MRKHLWIGVLIAGLGLYFSFRGISLDDLWTSLRQANPSVIAIALLLYFVDYSLRTIRWKLLLAGLCTARFFPLFRILLLGFFANNVLPFRLGEIARAVLCSNKYAIPKTSALGTIVMERLCDAISFLLTFFVASTFFPFPGYMKKGAVLMGGACAVGIGVLLLLRWREQLVMRAIERLPLSPRWMERITSMTRNFSQSTVGSIRARVFLPTMAFSVIIWTLEATFLYLIAYALNVPLPYSGAFFLLFALGLSVALPQAPGYVGTFEFFGVTALAFLGIPKEQGLPVILTVHGLQFILITILGITALWQEGLSFKALTGTTQKS